MELEKIIKIVIAIHAISGACSLIFGAGAILAKKGGGFHKLAGKLFYHSMLFSAICAVAVSVSPKHHSAFLFSLGVFTIYLLIGGKRSILYKGSDYNILYDKILAWLMLLCGSAMVVLPQLINSKFNIVLLVFGSVGVLHAIFDFMNLNNPERLKVNYLRLHIIKMLGGYIAVVSAFMVVNNFLPGIWNWFAASFVGVPYIIYHLRSLRMRTMNVT